MLSQKHIELQLSVVAGSYCGFFCSAACCGHHGIYKDLKEACCGQSASVTISFQ